MMMIMILLPLRIAIITTNMIMTILIITLVQAPLRFGGDAEEGAMYVKVQVNYANMEGGY